MKESNLEEKNPMFSIRQALDLSRSEMGAKIGVSRTFVWELETGRKKTPLEHAASYADILSEISDGDEPEYNQAHVLAALQWHVHVSWTIFEKVQDEAAGPLSKVEHLRRCINTMEDVKDLDVPEEIREGAQWKIDDMSKALLRLEEWLEERPEETGKFTKVAEDVTADIA